MSEVQDNISMLDEHNKDFSSRFLLFFSAFIIISCVTYFFCVTFIPIPEKNIRFADIILGFVAGTLTASIINFYWGSSKSSRDKDDTLSNIAKKLPTPDSPDGGSGTIKNVVEDGNNITVSPSDSVTTITKSENTP